MAHQSQPPGATKDRTIRVFISSTFRDMRSDRDILVKKVFPQLRKLCESRGVLWTEVDLRWGITTEQQAEGKVLPYCLAEIERSRPYFIGLLGERYGWVPESIPGELIETQQWLKEHKKRSITELEILHGVLNKPSMAERALFYFRDPAYVISISENQNDFIETGPDATLLQQKLNDLKNRIRTAAKQKKLSFAPRENYANPEALSELVLADFTRIIDELYPEDQVPTQLEQDIILHKRYARFHPELYIPRPYFFQVLDEHVANDGPPLVLTGEGGCGKTMLLAYWIDRWREQHPDDLLIEHYIEATPNSRNAVTLLTGVLHQVRKNIGFESEVPSSREHLYAWFGYFLGEAARKRRFTLVIDGVNHLDRDPESPELGWLPAEFPSDCRIILSTGHGRCLDLLERHRWPVLEVKPLDISERRHLVAAFLKSCGKTLAIQEIEQIVSCHHAGNPRFLTWLLDELRYVDHPDHLTIRLEECLRAEGIEAILGLMVRRWLVDYAEDCDLAHRCLTLLLVARDGLSETELLSALMTADRKSVPRALATPFLFAAEPVLAQSGYQLLIRRGRMEQLIRELVMPTPNDALQAHNRLAEYFCGLDDTAERKVRELPWHLAQTEQWQELHDLLMRPAILRLLVDKYHKDLVNYWKWLRPRFDPVISYRNVWDGYRRSLPHDRDWAFLSCAVGETLYFLGQYESSLDMLTEATKVLEVIDGCQSVSYASAAKTLGVGLFRAGHGQKAVYWLRQALDSFRKTIGLYNPATFSATNSLAGCLQTLGDYETAELLLRQVIKDSKEIFGLHAPTTLMAMNNLAGLFQQRQVFAEAEPLQRQVMEILRQTTSDDDPFLLTAMNNLAGTLEAQGKLDEAEERYREVFVGRVQVLGEKHPDTVEVMSNIANLLAQKGDFHSSKSLFERGLAIFDQLANTNQVTQALMSQNYAILLAKMGELPEAEKRCRQSLRLFRSSLHSDHPYTLGCIENLGGILLEKGDPAAAVPMLREAIDGYLRAVGKGHPRIHAVIIALAAAYAAIRDLNAAKSLLQEHGIDLRAKQSNAGSPHEPQSTEASYSTAFGELMAAKSYDDLYAILERFPFITGTDFISRLEALAARKSSGAGEAILLCVALLRHLATGRPLNAECNPVAEAFAAICQTGMPCDEQMLLRLYPFLRLAPILAEVRRMAEKSMDNAAAENIARIAQYLDKEGAGSQ